MPLGWPPNNADRRQDGEPDYVEFDPEQRQQHRPRLASRAERWMERTGPSGAGQRRQRQPVVRPHRRAHPRQELPLVCKWEAQVLAPGLTPKPEEADVTNVLASPYTVPLGYLRWPIQFESRCTSQTNDVIVAIDHWSLWEPV
jgi:hypothetical protein